jgi:hypothetical protein
MTKQSFLLQVGLVLAGAALLLAYPLAVYATPAIRSAIAAGALLSTANVLLGYAAIEYAFHRSATTFLKAVVGGMGVRMVVMLAALTGLILLAGMHAVALMASLMGFYAVFLVLEIFFIQRKVSLKNEG